METTTKKPKKSTLKSAKKPVEKPSKFKEGYGILKGKLHFDDSVFNLGL